MTMEVRFELDPLTSEPVRALVATHLRLMRSQSPRCSVHALPIDGLRAPEVRFWSAWVRDELVGCGALATLGPTEGEIKSMHVVAQRRGQGLARTILAHLEDQARRSGMTRLSLETGSQPEYAPARRLYASFGYEVCEPFGDYRPDPNSVFMTRAL